MAELGKKSNVIVGAASVYLGDFGTAEPTLTGGYRTAFDDDAEWRNVGYTQDGLEISNEPSYAEIEVDQVLDAVRMFKDGMSMSISTTFAESTLENLLVAWGQAAGTLTSTASGREIELTGGELGDAPEERALVAVGPAPGPDGSNAFGERMYHAYRVISVEGASISMSRADAATIPVTFRALPDDDGKYGIVRDRQV